VEALHVTVRFLGAVPPSRLPDVEEAAQAAVRGFEPFSLDLDRVGTFPGGRGIPRVIWLGLERNLGYITLSRLSVRLEEELDARGFAQETREFAPHLTLARVRDGRPWTEYDGLREAVDLLETSFDSRSFLVAALTVFRSDLEPGGPRYTALARPPLTGR
jgi:RNA 2',3'-cyclic 3'-phosphodiesterase